MGSQYTESGKTQESSEYFREPAIPGALVTSEWHLVRCLQLGIEQTIVMDCDKGCIRSPHGFWASCRQAGSNLVVSGDPGGI